LTSSDERKENIFLRLKHKLHLTPKKKVEDNPPKPFEKFKKKQETNPSTSTPSPSSSSTRITYSRKIRIPHLRTFKRYTAGILFLINFFLLLITATTSNVMSAPMTLFFLGNTFVLLDYLYKTSHLKIVRDERK